MQCVPRHLYLLSCLLHCDDSVPFKPTRQNKPFFPEVTFIVATRKVANTPYRRGNLDKDTRTMSPEDWNYNVTNQRIPKIADRPPKSRTQAQAQISSQPYGESNSVPPWFWIYSWDWNKFPLLKPSSLWLYSSSFETWMQRLHPIYQSKHWALSYMTHLTWEINWGRSRGTWDHFSSCNEVPVQLMCPHYAAC